MLKELSEIARRDSLGFFAKPHEPLESYLTQPFHEENLSFESDVFQKTVSATTSSIPIEYNSKKLWPWEAACCCIDAEGKAVIYVGKIGEQHPPIIAHELLHAMRRRIDSPVFEEHIAYAICHQMFPDTVPMWRVATGPLFTSPMEVVIFLASFWIVWLVPLFFDWEAPLLFFFLPLLYLLYASARLAIRWQKWNRAVEIMHHVFPSKEYAVLVRLSDEEIIWLSSLETTTCRGAIEEKAKNEWRWQFFLEQFQKTCDF